MNRVLFLFLLFFFTLFTSLFGQKLKPGFNKQEFLEMIYLSARHADTVYYKNIPKPEKFKIVYRSPTMGLLNRWDLAISKDSVAAISVRGTTRSSESWLENFYSAMVPATGELTLSKDFTFKYKLANNPQAAVHVGWLLGTASLSRDILAKLDSCSQAGIRSFIVVGHSQGGAIAYLLTAYLRQLQQEGRIARRIQFKTYCIAAPKPGNLYFAYDYEAATANGWACNVINTADWEPETPVSIQTIHDFNPLNPFKNARGLIKKQKFPLNLAMGYAFNQLDKPTRKALRKNQKYLGTLAGKFVKKQLPEFVPPSYFPSANYMRAGNFIILPANEAYYKIYPNTSENAFTHHLLGAYLYLARKLPAP
ncbi:MAG: lipase family protein [Adhaeribacter sp.]